MAHDPMGPRGGEPGMEPWGVGGVAGTADSVYDAESGFNVS